MPSDAMDSCEDQFVLAGHIKSFHKVNFGSIWPLESIEWPALSFETLAELDMTIL